jgi:hypothetical protein
MWMLIALLAVVASEDGRHLRLTPETLIALRHNIPLTVRLTAASIDGQRVIIGDRDTFEVRGLMRGDIDVSARSIDIEITNRGTSTLEPQWGHATLVDTAGSATDLLATTYTGSTLPAGASGSASLHVEDHRPLFGLLDAGKSVRVVLPVTAGGRATVECTLTFAVTLDPALIAPHRSESHASDDTTISVGDDERRVTALLGAPSEQVTGFIGPTSAEFLAYPRLGYTIAISKGSRAVIALIVEP